jgi:hypothetical protein
MKTMRFVLGLAAAVALSAAGPAPVSGPLVSCDRWPRATNLVSWTADVMRIEGLENATETAQGKAFFEWLRLFSRMAVGGMIQAYEGPHGRERYVTDAHKTFFVYGWGYCDTTSRIAEAAWKEYKRDPRAAGRVCVQHEDGGYHTMYRLRLDGRYGAFDPRYGYYLVERDEPGARVLDWNEVGVDETFLRNRAFRHRSRPFFEILGLEWERALLLNPGWFDGERQWKDAGAPKEFVFGDSQYQMGTRFHDMDFTLWKGVTIERFWDNTARKFYRPAGKHTQREWPFLPSGRFYRVTETSLDGNWPKHDPNYERARPNLALAPRDEGYPEDVAGGRSIGQAWGVLRYAPRLQSADSLDALAAGATLVHSPAAPHLRPGKPAEGGAAVYDIYSPYVMVDGTLAAELAGAGARIEMRVLEPKTGRASEADAWGEWQTLAGEAGRHKLELGRPRFNGKDASIHGVYRFQLRVSVDPRPGRATPAGLSALKLDLYFENGIMSIPRIFAGRNTLRFQLRDAARLRGPVEVVYRYQTSSGNRIARRTLQAGDFRGNEAEWNVDAAGLVRCNSLAISY